MRALLALAALALPAAPPAATAPPGGTVRSDRAAIEVLPPRPGPAEVRTPEGFLRMDGPPASGMGSFGVYRASGGRPAPPAAEPSARPGGEAGSGAGQAGGPPPSGPERCRAERGRYLRRLLRSVGIDLADPVSFLDALGGPGASSSALLFSAYGLLAGVDPIHPLAWDFELQGLARDLAACAAGESGRAR